MKGGLNVDTHQAHVVPVRPMLPMLPEVPEVGAVDSRYTSSSLTTTVPGASFMVGDLINVRPFVLRTLLPTLLECFFLSESSVLERALVSCPCIVLFDESTVLACVALGRSDGMSIRCSACEFTPASSTLSSSTL